MNSRYVVLYIHHGGGIGGAPVSMLQLAAKLDRSRYEAQVVFTRPGPILTFAREMDVSARVVPLRSAFFYSAHVPIRARMLLPFIVRFLPTVQSAQTLVEQVKPDLVHLNTSVLIPAAIGVKRTEVPLVWHVREVPGPNPLLRRWQTGCIQRLADRIIVNSQTVARAFQNQAKVDVVHNAVDLDRFNPGLPSAGACIRTELGLPVETPVVGMIGSVQAVKGHFLLVEAARHVVQAVPDVRFLIVAGGLGPAYARSWKGRVKRALGMPLDNLARMRRLIESAGLTKYFCFSGYRTDIPQMLAAMDVLAFPSLAAEGFGRPLIEAMAMQRPVAASDIGPSREILGEGTSLLVPPGDAEALASALVRLIQDPEMRQQMGQVGRQRVEQLFDLERHVGAIQKVYDKVLAEADSRVK